MVAKRTEAPANVDENGEVIDQLTFGGELGGMLKTVRRHQRWVIFNPKDDTRIPPDSIVHHGYPCEIAGTVVTIEEIPTKFGPMPVYVLDVGKGPDFPLIRWGLTALVLQNLHDRHDVRPGDTIAAVCHGMREGHEQTYEDWAMIVKSSDGNVSAPSLAADEEPF